VGISLAAPPQIESQIGRDHIQVLLYSGSVRSLISFKHFKSVTSNGVETKFGQTDLSCVNASGQSLEIVEVKLNLKIHGLTWNCPFFMSKNLRGPPILGADFMCTLTWC